MAKASNVSFRKVDVDKIIGEGFTEDAGDKSSLMCDATGIKSLIMSKKIHEALKLIANDKSLKSKKKESKEPLVALFVQCTSNIKSTDIDQLINGLSDEELESLLKVLYLTFALKSESDMAIYHSWFEKIFAQVGSGGILRAVTDRSALILN